MDFQNPLRWRAVYCDTKAQWNLSNAFSTLKKTKLVACSGMLQVRRKTIMEQEDIAESMPNPDF